ncbi:MAG: hypothetical protein ACRDVD_08470, partial [Acidimicrobiia bacterium]
MGVVVVGETSMPIVVVVSSGSGGSGGPRVGTVVGVEVGEVKTAVDDVDVDEDEVEDVDDVDEEVEDEVDEDEEVEDEVVTTGREHRIT